MGPSNPQVFSALRQTKKSRIEWVHFKKVKQIILYLKTILHTQLSFYEQF